MRIPDASIINNFGWRRISGRATTTAAAATTQRPKRLHHASGTKTPKNPAIMRSVQISKSEMQRRTGLRTVC